MDNLDEILLRAQQIAHDAHAGVKRDITEENYVNHPKRVAENFPHDILLQAAGWLHDVVEDNLSWPLERLRAEGFPDSILSLVDALTRRKSSGETYSQFIQRVKRHSPEAVKVKIADLNDNLRNLPLNDTRRARYLKALDELNS